MDIARIVKKNTRAIVRFILPKKHIKSKKHRKYAEHKPNFENLDKLIKKVKDRIIKIGDQFDRTLLGNHAQAMGCTLTDSDEFNKGSILKRSFAEDVPIYSLG